MLRKDVLRNKADFDAIYKKGKSQGDRYVVVFYKKNDLGFNRICFLASKKVGNSVKRNRARRLMKESFRNLEDVCPTGYDLIIIARNSISGRKQQEVEYSLKNALKRAGLLNKNQIN